MSVHSNWHGWNIAFWTQNSHHLLTLSASLDACVCVCVDGGVCRWTACERQQFRRPVSRITWQPYSMKAYAQMNSLGKWVNKGRRVERWKGVDVGGGRLGVGSHTCLPVCRRQLRLPRAAELSVSIFISVCLLPSLPLTHAHVIPLFY